MTNSKGISNIKKNKANEIKLEKDVVNEYKDALSISFNTVNSEKNYIGDKNDFYYVYFVSNFSDYLSNELKSNRDLNTKKELEVYNRMIIDLLNEIVLFFIGIKNYDSRNK